MNIIAAGRTLRTQVNSFRMDPKSLSSTAPPNTCVAARLTGFGVMFVIEKNASAGAVLSVAAPA